MLYQLAEKRVRMRGEGHFVAPNATVIGDVVLESQSSVWFNVVIRADADAVVIGEGSNIQDGAVLHVDPGFPLHLGKHVTVGHKVMLHGCSIGDGSLIGINAVVLNGAKIGRNCLIGANALVTEGSVIPDGSMVVGVPGKVKRQLSEDEIAALRRSAEHYIGNAARFARDLQVQQS